MHNDVKEKLFWSDVTFLLKSTGDDSETVQFYETLRLSYLDVFYLFINFCKDSFTNLITTIFQKNCFGWDKKNFNYECTDLSSFLSKNKNKGNNNRMFRCFIFYKSSSS